MAPQWWRIPFAGLLAVHGLAHLVGTTEAINASRDETSVQYLFDQWTITNPTVLMVLAVVWATLAVTFVVAAAAMWKTHRRWRRLLVFAAAGSFAMCVLGLVPTAVGLVVNGVLLMWTIATRPTRGSRSV